MAGEQITSHLAALVDLDLQQALQIESRLQFLSVKEYLSQLLCICIFRNVYNELKGKPGSSYQNTRDYLPTRNLGVKIHYPKTENSPSSNDNPPKPAYRIVTS